MNEEEPKVDMKTEVTDPSWVDDEQTKMQVQVIKTLTYSDDISIMQQWQNNRRSLLDARCDALASWLLIDKLTEHMERSPEQDAQLREKIANWSSIVIGSFEGNDDALQQFVMDLTHGSKAQGLKAQKYAEDVEKWTSFRDIALARYNEKVKQARLEAAKNAAKEKEGRRSS